MIDINAFLIEGMIAIRGLLEGRMGQPNPNAALRISEVMHNFQPNPMMLNRVSDDLVKLREDFPDVANRWLPQTFAWLDAKTGAN